MLYIKLNLRNNSVAFPTNGQPSDLFIMLNTKP